MENESPGPDGISVAFPPQDNVNYVSHIFEGGGPGLLKL
jgi:hypothetical protein